MELQKINKRNNQRKPAIDTSTMVYGKVPPQSKELETIVLGALMVDKQAFEIATDILTSECFYVDAHQRIYKAIEDLVATRMPVDLMTVVEQLKKNEELEMVGGAYYVVQLTNGVISSAHIEGHCRIILQKFLSRELIRISGEIIGSAYEESTDVFDLLDFAEEHVGGLRMKNVRKNFKSLRSIMADNLKSLEELRRKDESVTGVSSGFDELDKVTAGWQPTDLIILAARPSVGKTAFALTLGKNAARSYLNKHLNGEKKKAVGFFSLEMADKQLVNRMLSSESNVWMWRLNNGRLDHQQMRDVYDGVDRMNQLEFFIDDTPSLKIQEFQTKARIMVRKNNVGIIFVDYLQLMTNPNKKMREQEIASISSGLKQTAKELDIPIIALSQMTREFGKPGTGNREPQLSDLRESGAIEQDADMVMMMFKPTDAEIEEDRNLENIFYNKIVKFRNGTAPVKFIGKFEKNTQTHEWLKVVDGKTMMPVGGNWKPVPTEKTNELFQVNVGDKMDSKNEMPF